MINEGNVIEWLIVCYLLEAQTRRLLKVKRRVLACSSYQIHLCRQDLDQEGEDLVNRLGIGQVLIIEDKIKTKRQLDDFPSIGVTLHLVGSGLLGLFGITELPMFVQLIVVLPILVQEMVMAVWMIVKGFNPAAIPSMPVINSPAIASKPI